MKKKLIFELIRILNNGPEGRRHLKKLFVAGFFAFIVIGGFSVWAVSSVVSYGASFLRQNVDSTVISTQIGNVKTGMENLQFQKLDCINQARSLFDLNSWLEKPIQDIFQSLKFACIKPELESKCESVNCPQIKI